MSRAVLFFFQLSWEVCPLPSKNAKYNLQAGVSCGRTEPDGIPCVSSSLPLSADSPLLLAHGCCCSCCAPYSRRACVEGQQGKLETSALGYYQWQTQPWHWAHCLTILLNLLWAEFNWQIVKTFNWLIEKWWEEILGAVLFMITGK